MTWLILGALVFVGWLIGRRWLRIIAVCVLLYLIVPPFIEGWQEASARAQR